MYYFFSFHTVIAVTTAGPVSITSLLYFNNDISRIVFEVAKIEISCNNAPLLASGSRSSPQKSYSRYTLILFFRDIVGVLYFDIDVIYWTWKFSSRTIQLTFRCIIIFTLWSPGSLQAEIYTSVILVSRWDYKYILRIQKTRCKIGYLRPLLGRPRKRRQTRKQSVRLVFNVNDTMPCRKVRDIYFLGETEICSSCFTLQPRRFNFNFKPEPPRVSWLFNVCCWTLALHCLSHLYFSWVSRYTFELKGEMFC